MEHIWNIYDKFMEPANIIEIHSKYMATSCGNYLILSLFRGFQGLIVVHPSLGYVFEFLFFLGKTFHCRNMLQQGTMWKQVLSKGTDMRIDMSMQRWGAMR